MNVLWAFLSMLVASQLEPQDPNKKPFPLLLVALAVVGVLMVFVGLLCYSIPLAAVALGALLIAVSYFASR